MISHTPDFITTVDAAAHLGVSVRRVQKLIADGRLPATKLGRDYVIRRIDLAVVADRRPGYPKGRPRKTQENEHLLDETAAMNRRTHTGGHMTRRTRARRTYAEDTTAESLDGHLNAPAPLRTSRTQQEPPRAILIAVAPAGPAPADGVDAPWETEASLEELAGLASAVGVEPVRLVSQKLRSAHPRTYLNEGKARYVAELMRAEDCALVLVDDELTPAQQKGLEAICGAGRVVDRTALILEIFGQRARTHEGILQVQLAQARYGLPRLARLWTHLERQRGGTGTRGGAGETQIESDRRLIRRRITRLERELESVRRSRATQRAKRREVGMSVALVGYTNAGKSTLLNRLTRGGAEAADKLFATLDPTTRRWNVAPDRSLLLTDTVGFIHKLPAGLVAAFRATLEELNEADLLLHVVDASSLHALGQAAVVLDELENLGATAPVLTVFSKVDLLPPDERAARLAALWARFPEGVAVSARTGEGLELLASRAAVAVDGHGVVQDHLALHAL